VDYYTATKKNEIESFSDKWMEPEIFKLSERSQVQKDKGRVFSLMWKIHPNLSECTYTDIISQFVSLSLKHTHKRKMFAVVGAI
jgi:hypothetical protein